MNCHLAEAAASARKRHNYLCWVTTPSANSGATSLGSNQVAPSERQMCAFARSDIGVSKQPSRKRTFCWFTRSAIMCEPHREQKRRNLPGDDSYDLSRSSPLIHRNDWRGTGITLENADARLTRATRLSEVPPSSASRLIARPERSTKIW